MNEYTISDVLVVPTQHNQQGARFTIHPLDQPLRPNRLTVWVDYIDPEVNALKAAYPEAVIRAEALLDEIYRRGQWEGVEDTDDIIAARKLMQ